MPQVIPVAIGIAASAASAAGTAGLFGLGATLFSIGTFSVTVGAALGAALTVAGGVAQMLLSRGGNRDTSRAGASPIIRQETFNEPTALRWADHGRVLRGAPGGLVFWDTTAENAGDMWRVLVTDCHKTSAIEEHRINNEPLTIDGSNQITAPAKWAGNYVVSRLGTPDQLAVQELVDALPTLWTTAHRLRGLCYTVLSQSPVAQSAAFETYPGGARGEQYTQVARAGELYDPRTEATAYTRNGALALLFALTWSHHGALPLSRFALNSWKDAADNCGSTVLNGRGETQIRYGLSHRVTAPEPGRATADTARLFMDYLTAIDGVFYDDPDDNGRIGIQIGMPFDDPELPLTVDHVLSVVEEDGAPLGDFYDGVRVEYTEPEYGFQLNVTPPYGDAGAGPGFITGDPTGLRVDTVKLPMVDSYDHALRIAKKLYYRRTARRAEVETNLAGVLYRIGSPITFDLPSMGAADMWRVVNRRVDLARARVSLSIEHVAPAYRLWNAATESLPLPVPPLMSGTATGIAAPQDLRAAATTGGKVRVAWREPSYPNLTVEIEVSATFPPPKDYDSFFTHSPASDCAVEIDTSAETTDTIHIRARFKTGANTFTLYSEIEDIDRTAPVAAQAAPTFTGPATSESSLIEGLSVTPASGVALWTVQIFEWLEGAPVQIAQRCIHTGGAFAATAVASQGTGQKTLSATITNLSGNTSAHSATINVQVTGPGLP